MINKIIASLLLFSLISCTSETKKMDPSGKPDSKMQGEGPEKKTLSRLEQGRTVQKVGKNWLVTFNQSKPFPFSLEIKLDRNRYEDEISTSSPHPYTKLPPKIFLADPDRLQVAYKGDPKVFDENFVGKIAIRVKLNAKVQERAAKLSQQLKREIFPILYLESCNEGGHGESSVEALPSTYDQISNEVFAEVRNGQGFWSACDGSEKGLFLSVFIGLPGLN